MGLLFFFEDLARNSSTSNKWFTEPTIPAAIITALFTITGIVLKDFVLKRFEERRSDQKARSAIYERYSNPLVSSTISLLNRLHEILCQEHRPVYLRGAGINSSPSQGGEFRSYKKLSTIYRLATVLGWIRACRREFSYLRVAEPGDTSGVDEAIDDFENALADGNWVEQERVVRLCELWHLSTSEKLQSDRRTEVLGVQVDNLIWDYLGLANIDDVSLLNEELRLVLCRRIADCLSSHLRTNAVSDASMDRSWPDAFSIIGMREAWVYRDWQSAIGDIMIQPSQSDTRKFEVIGYGDFEQILSVGSEKQKLALARLLAILDNLDFSIEDRFDARPRQLRSIAKASAKLILAIHRIQGKQSIVSVKALERANTIIGMSTIQSAFNLQVP